MGEGFIVRRGGVVEEVDTTATPTITEVSVTTDSITFTVTNNDTDEAIVYYDLDPVVDFSVDSVTLDDGDTSSNITISDLDDDEEYIVYAIASAFGKQFSPQASLAITTDEAPPTFELLFDSTGTVTFPQTSINITGLNIGKNDELRMVYTFVGATSNNKAMLVGVNGITSNYHNQRLSGVGSTISALRQTNGAFGELGSDHKEAGTMDIKLSENGKFVAQSQNLIQIGSDSANVRQVNHNVINTDTITSITSILISTSTTNEIASGSRIRLYKVNTGDA
jgi:hypothetical protein